MRKAHLYVVAEQKDYQSLSLSCTCTATGHSWRRGSWTRRWPPASLTATPSFPLLRENVWSRLWDWAQKYLGKFLHQFFFYVFWPKKRKKGWCWPILLVMMYLNAESAAEAYSSSLRANDRVTGNLKNNKNVAIIKELVLPNITITTMINLSTWAATVSSSFRTLWLQLSSSLLPWGCSAKFPIPEQDFLQLASDWYIALLKLWYNGAIMVHAS